MPAWRVVTDISIENSCISTHRELPIELYILVNSIISHIWQRITDILVSYQGTQKIIVRKCQLSSASMACQTLLTCSCQDNTFHYKQGWMCETGHIYSLLTMLGLSPYCGCWFYHIWLAFWWFYYPLTFFAPIACCTFSLFMFKIWCFVVVVMTV